MTAAAHRLRISLACLFVLSSLFITPPGPRAEQAASGRRPSAAGITFSRRVQAQEAIERVYYGHQVGATTPFEKEWTQALLKRKVRTELRESLALEKLWNAPVSGEALSAELQRIARDTRFPDRLQEIYGALGNDRFLVEESLARASLVDRLTRSYFARDQRIHASARAEAEDLRRQVAGGVLDPRSDHPRRSVQRIVRGPSMDTRGDDPRSGIAAPDVGRDGATEWTLDAVAFAARRSLAPRQIGSVGDIEETPDAFVFRALLDAGSDSAEIASWVVPKKSWDEWWSEVEKGLDDRKVPAVSLARTGDPLPPPRASSSSAGVSSPSTVAEGATARGASMPWSPSTVAEGATA